MSSRCTFLCGTHGQGRENYGPVYEKRKTGPYRVHVTWASFDMTWALPGRAGIFEDSCGPGRAGPRYWNLMGRTGPDRRWSKL